MGTIVAGKGSILDFTWGGVREKSAVGKYVVLLLDIVKGKWKKSRALYEILAALFFLLHLIMTTAVSDGLRIGLWSRYRGHYLSE